MYSADSPTLVHKAIVETLLNNVGNGFRHPRLPGRRASDIGETGLSAVSARN